MSIRLPPVRCRTCGKVFHMATRYENLVEKLQEGVTEKQALSVVKFQPEFEEAKRLTLDIDKENRVSYPGLYESQPIKNLVQEMTEGVTPQRASEIALNALGITRYCCRTELLQGIEFPAGAYYYEEHYQPDTYIVTSSGKTIGDTKIFAEPGKSPPAAKVRNANVRRIQLEKRDITKL